MTCEFKTRRRVEFAETDCAGILHFSVYFRYMEEVEHAFLRSCGLSVHTPDGKGSIIGFPRISTRYEFIKAVTFEDEVDIHLWISRLGSKTIEYSCEFSHQGEAIGRGTMVVIACLVTPDKPIKAIHLPETFLDALEVASYPPLRFHMKSKGEPS